MSSRWSYGPEGLREVPVKSRWDAERMWPRWRELQPVLLRSAGAVGLAGVIVTVIAGNGWYASKDDAPRGEGPPPVVLHAAGESAAAAVDLVPVTTANPMPNPAASVDRAPLPLADATPTPKPAAAAALELRPSAWPGPVTPAEPVPPVEPVALALGSKADPRGGGREPVAPAETASIPAPQMAEAIAVPPSVEADTIRLVEAPAAGPEADAIGGPLHPTAGPDAVALDEPLRPAAPEAPATISLAALAPADVAELEIDTAQSIWTDHEMTCPRDWVSDDVGGSDESSPDCAPTAELIASVANEDLFALEEAAAEQAEMLAALPRVPLARPEPPADFKPTKPHATRVSNRNSSWPAEPPPNCAAGQHAKWRFVDRNAGTKEWYCR